LNYKLNNKIFLTVLLERIMNKTPTTKCLYDPVGEIFQLYIVSIVDLFGIVANGFCIVIFIKILKRPHSIMFKYLLMKSIADFLVNLFNSFQCFYFCSYCKSSSSLIMQIWYVGFYFYLSNIVEAASNIFAIAATFECYITITSNFQCCQKNLFFYTFSVVLIIVICILYIVSPLGLVVKRKIEIDSKNNETYSSFYQEFNHFGLSSLYYTIGMVNAIIRDYIFLFILLILNIMILFLLKKTTQRRRTLVSTNRNQNNLSTASQNAEKKQILMVIATGFNYFIGHVPFSILFVINFIYNGHSSCSFIYVYFLYYLSYANSIFFYFFFNNVFKRFLIELIPFVSRNN
jgi:hypothetical protein